MGILILLCAAAEIETHAFQRCQELPAEHPGKYFDGDEEFLSGWNPLTDLVQSAAGNNTVDMRMKMEILPPSMKYLNAADLCAKIFLVPGQLCQRFSCTGKKKTIQFFLVRQEKRIQFRRNREYDMKVLDIQQIKALVFNPALFQQRLAFGAMPVPAGIVGRPLVSAIRTLIHMTAQSSGSALPYCIKRFPLLDCHRMAAFICFAIFGKYILDFWHTGTPLTD